MKAKQNLELKGAVGDFGAPLTPTETQQPISQTTFLQNHLLHL